MEKWELWLLIALVLGVMISNLMVLKHTANMKLPPFFSKVKKTKQTKSSGTNTDKRSERLEDPNSWGKQDWQSDQWDKEDWK